MKNITSYFLLPATITEQEKVDFEIKICKLTGLMDDEGNLTDPLTTGHSEYLQHPTNGTFVYAVNGLFEKRLTQAEKDSCTPSLNFATADDDTLYSSSDPLILDFFSTDS